MIKKILSRFGNDSVAQVLSLSLSEQFAYLRYLVDCNTTQLNQEGYETASPWFVSGPLNLSRRHFQLPCSTATREKRAWWMTDHAWHQRTVLLLGDDDLVAVELTRFGFTDVHVVDCDERVLAMIRDATDGARHPPRLECANLAAPDFTPPVQADVVCLDPPYNLRWAKIFVDAALRATRERTVADIAIMTNPACFKPLQLEQIFARLRDGGFELKTHIPLFNRYPVFGLSKVLIRTWLMISRGEPFPLRKAPIFFGSDLFHFSKGPS